MSQWKGDHSPVQPLFVSWSKSSLGLAVGWDSSVSKGTSGMEVLWISTLIWDRSLSQPTSCCRSPSPPFPSSLFFHSYDMAS